MNDTERNNDLENINNSDSEARISGFDSVNGTDTRETDSGSGYTVTPESGYYTRQKDEIIQDNAQTESAPQSSDSGNVPPAEPPRSYYSQPYGYNYRPVKPKKEKKHNKRYGLGAVVLAALLAAVIGASSGIAAVKLTSDKNKTVDLSSGVSGSNVNINVDETAESVVEAVADKVTPSVVGIRTTTSVTSFFGGSSESTGEGSGVVYSSDGYIITNYHVISGALSGSGSKIEVFLDNKASKSYTATVIGYNISVDLAVIKIDVTGLTPVEIGDSSNLKVGQYVVTIGNPGGLEFMRSVTYGVISGLNRVVSSDSNVELIQTDAAINPGNSGGALVNTKGQLVGINSSKIVSEEYEGMGFAIPVNTVVEVCKSIISKENDHEPYIGITISERYTAEVLKFYGYPTGAVVLSVADGSPAESAGIKKGDIVTEFNGTKITEYNVLDNLLQECSPKQTVEMKIYRNGRYYTTDITIGANN